MNVINKILLSVLVIINSFNLIIYDEIRKSNYLFCYFLDIGQGDSTLLKYKSRTIIIDGGDNQKNYNQNIRKKIKTKNVKTIDLMILSHPHADHLYGLYEIIKSFPVSKIIIPLTPHTTDLYKKFIHKASEKNIPILYGEAGTEINIGRYFTLKILSPFKNAKFKDIDNNSIVLKLEYQNKTILFTGDIFTEAEKFLVNHYKEYLKSDILKVPHHGSDTSSSELFLKFVSPDTALIFCGKNNKYNLPKEQIVKRIGKWSKKIHRTDNDGELTLIIHNNRIDYL